MLSFHLRQRFPELRCFAFNPPGGLLSAPLSRLARPFCTSVVVGCDIISRMSVSNTKVCERTHALHNLAQLAAVECQRRWHRHVPPQG